MPFIKEQAVGWLKSGVQDWFLVFLSLFYSVIASTSLDLSGFAHQFGVEMDLFLHKWTRSAFGISFPCG